jgi:Ubiquitin-activating enzyme active site
MLPCTFIHNTASIIYIFPLRILHSYSVHPFSSLLISLPYTFFHRTHRSRRRPIPLIFDPTDPTHRSFVLWAAVLRGRVCGMTDLRSPSDTRLVDAFQELGPGSPVDSAIPGVTGEALLGSLLVKMGAGTRAFLLSSMCPEEFEKDDAELGHVDFATVAANLR